MEKPFRQFYQHQRVSPNFHKSSQFPQIFNNFINFPTMSTNYGSILFATVKKYVVVNLDPILMGFHANFFIRMLIMAYTYLQPTYESANKKGLRHKFEYIKCVH